jgi:hypothetical protein
MIGGQKFLYAAVDFGVIYLIFPSLLITSVLTEK